MQLISTIAELRTRLTNERAIAFVPTMGNLHEGHLILMRLAREHGSCVVASIFVNPLQFGPSEDFDRYPRTLDADCAKLQGFADLVFAPSVNEMYSSQQTVFVEPPTIANELEGASRPGHFRGRRHCAFPGPIRRKNSRRALGRCRTPGPDGRAEHAWRAAKIRRRIVLLEPAL